MTIRRATALAWAASLVLGFSTAAAHAQARYPSQPIQLVVPAGAGGSTDLFARRFGQRLGERLGTSVVPVNKGGAGGALGTGEVAKASPDGHTLLMGTTGNLVVNPLTMQGLGFDARKDLVPVAVLAMVSFCIAVNNQFPARTVPEMVAVLRKNPGKFSYATNGPAGFIHLTTELFSRQVGGIDFVQVPYKGGSSPHQDLIAGNVQIYFDALNAALPLHKSGRVRILATTGAKRSAAAPEIPTATEAGVPGMVSETAFILAAPAGTPSAVIERLAAESASIMADAEFQRDLQASATEAVTGSGPAHAQAFVDGEYAKWTPIVKQVLGR